MSRYAVKRDGNHGPIEAVFRKMLADHVTDCSAWGYGAGDLYVSFGKFPGVFVEIKKDGKAPYTAHQVAFQRTHPRAVVRCESVDQAIGICAGIRLQASLMR
jgi:hypothetical protein